MTLCTDVHDFRIMNLDDFGDPRLVSPTGIFGSEGNVSTTIEQIDVNFGNDIHIPCSLSATNLYPPDSCSIIVRPIFKSVRSE